MTGDQWIRVPVTWNTPWPAGKYRVRLSEMYDRDPNMVLFHYVRLEINVAFSRKLKTRVAPLENVWMYEDSVHPHGDMNPRPIAWQDSPKYDRWTSNQLQLRWRPNDYMQ